ncbi:MAG: hypothetical protein WCR49_15570, partial [Opitutae bacterium]
IPPYTIDPLHDTAVKSYTEAMDAALSRGDIHGCGEIESKMVSELGKFKPILLHSFSDLSIMSTFHSHESPHFGMT